MQTKITTKENYIEITIEELGDNKDRVLKSLGLCQVGQCNCPTNEYENLEKMEMDEENNGLIIRLHPKAGKNLDLNEIKKCLDFTTKQAS